MLRNNTASDMARRPSYTQRTSNAMENLMISISGSAGFNEAEIPAAIHRPLTFGTGAFSRRMTNRYNAELDYVQQRLEQGKNLSYTRTHPDITGIAELDGKEIDEDGGEVVRDERNGGVRVSVGKAKGKSVVVKRSREQICLETAKEMMMPTVPEDEVVEGDAGMVTMESELVRPKGKLFDPEAESLREKGADDQKWQPKSTVDPKISKKSGIQSSEDVRHNQLSYDKNQETIRKTLTPGVARGPPSKENSPLTNVTNQTRMHLLGTNDEKKLSELMRMKSIIPKFKGYPQYFENKSSANTSNAATQQDMPSQRLRESFKQSLKKVTFGLAPVRPTGSNSVPIRRMASGLLAGTRTATRPSRFAERVSAICGVKYEPTLLGLPSDLRQKITDQVILCGGPVSSVPAGSAGSQLRNSLRWLFMLVNSCLLRSSSRPVRWLVALSREERSMLRHVEVSTKEMSSTICMMAGLGLKIVHRIPSYSLVDLMRDERASVWLTFTATSPSFRVGEVLPPVFETAPIDLWDGRDVVGEQGGDRGPVEDKRASLWTTGTSILGGEVEEYDGEVVEGEMIVAGRGKVVDV
ncbi:hypothetical protein LTR78_008968 [Recurvomyces mirabilis]|uniref:Uncharacterized protein n=1 Tax=Recurvomyces mirabilis TaxID=574656 RepID=A0AAE0WHJ6_9PEZI|nr:hypothetical protein LTR78_008968 [Recurvomyces mirabilis]KAK5159769.1 hypothetical protein LTS14_001874 [Recurvomyces mirabilis]